jgi:hypothetical protein
LLACWWQLQGAQQCSCERFEASTARHMNTALFWFITQRVVVSFFTAVSAQPFGSIFKGQESILDRPLKFPTSFSLKSLSLSQQSIPSHSVQKHSTVAVCPVLTAVTRRTEQLQLVHSALQNPAQLSAGVYQPSTLASAR